MHTPIHQYDDLESLGYKGFAVGFCGEFSQVIGTSTTLKLYTPPFLQYLNGVIVARKPDVITLVACTKDLLSPRCV